MYSKTTVRLWCAIVVGATAVLAGCTDNPLAIKNENNPDVARVYGTPRDVETIISKLFQQMWNAQNGAVGIGAQTQVMSFESHSALANFGMGARAAIPRGTISNSVMRIRLRIFAISMYCNGIPAVLPTRLRHSTNSLPVGRRLAVRRAMPAQDPLGSSSSVMGSETLR
jgi:hypothetical protein